MAGRECYHCKQWVEVRGGARLLTTTENSPHQGPLEDLQDAWERLRETAVSFGDQRIMPLATNPLMFSRKSCYFFVRPKRTFYEVCVFLGRRAEGTSGASHRSRIKSPKIVTSFR